MAHAPEPPFAHDRTPRIGVLLVNLGTPDAATPSAVRRYLAQFLTDPRVIEIPAWLWKPILYGVILFVRPTQSAKKYAAIWTEDGSPLLVHSVRQRTLLLGYLGQRLKAAGLPADLCPVELGMRYGNPSVGSAIDKLRAANCEKILVLPLYPAVFGQRDRRRRSMPWPRTCSTRGGCRRCASSRRSTTIRATSRRWHRPSTTTG